MKASTRIVSQTDFIDQVPAEVLPTPFVTWPDESFSLGHALWTGAILGTIAGSVSLLANVIGSVAWAAFDGVESSPLKLIQVYLTLLLGPQALELDSGLTLAGGCMLYLAIGALYGMLFEFVVEYLLPNASLVARAIVLVALSVVVWLVNFYGIVIWLQPLVFGRLWIVELIPWWVAAATHVLFGLTMAILLPIPIRLPEPID